MFFLLAFFLHILLMHREQLLPLGLQVPFPCNICQVLINKYYSSDVSGIADCRFPVLDSSYVLYRWPYLFMIAERRSSCPRTTTVYIDTVSSR